MAAGNDEQQLVLMDYWVSLFGMRVRVALAEKGMDQYESKEENLLSASRSPLLLEMNPVHKKIPVFIHNGKAVCESLIIVEYIDQVWEGNSRLLPSDPFQRSQARFWAHFVDNKVHPASWNLWTTQGESQEIAKKEFIKSLNLLEEGLGDKCYFGGDNFGFLDIALIPFYIWFSAYEICANFSIEEECPKILSWGKRCAQREVVQRSLPNAHKVSELVLELRKMTVTD